jgi:hypothetical protein
VSKPLCSLGGVLDVDSTPISTCENNLACSNDPPYHSRNPNRGFRRASRDKLDNDIHRDGQLKRISSSSGVLLLKKEGIKMS